MHLCVYIYHLDGMSLRGVFEHFPEFLNRILELVPVVWEPGLALPIPTPVCAPPPLCEGQHGVLVMANSRSVQAGPAPLSCPLQLKKSKKVFM